MQNGAGYAGFGCSCAGSAVQGARAGKAAAEYAKNEAAPVVGDSLLETLREEMLAPLSRQRGFSPAWVTRVMQGIMYPYHVMYVKEKSRLEAALSQIMYLQEKYGALLKTDDPHGLRTAHEARNMLLNAEMKLRAGLAREESRGTHFREDFPFRDDDNWLCWVKLVERDGADDRGEASDPGRVAAGPGAQLPREVRGGVARRGRVSAEARLIGRASSAPAWRRGTPA